MRWIIIIAVGRTLMTRVFRKLMTVFVNSIRAIGRLTSSGSFLMWNGEIRDYNIVWRGWAILVLKKQKTCLPFEYVMFGERGGPSQAGAFLKGPQHQKLTNQSSIAGWIFFCPPLGPNYCLFPALPARIVALFILNYFYLEFSLFFRNFLKYWAI